MTVILDSGSAGPFATITGGGLRVGATEEVKTGARADTVLSANKYVFEVTPTLLSFGTDTGVGLTSDVSPNYTNLALFGPGGGGLNGLIIYKAGAVKLNGVTLPSIASIGGNTIMFAIDFVNNLAWIKVTEAVGWNGFPTANPVTGAGGFDISGITAGGLYPVGVITSQINSAVFNFGATAFSRAVPAGYARWDGSVPAVVNPKAVILSRMAVFGRRMTGLATKSAMTSLWATTERRDTFAGTLGNTIGSTLDATERSDRFAGTVVSVDLPRYLLDGELISVPPETAMRVPAEPMSSRFVIPLERTITAIPFTEH